MRESGCSTVWRIAARAWPKINANCGFWANAWWISRWGTWEFLINVATWAAVLEVPVAIAAEKLFEFEKFDVGVPGGMEPKSAGSKLGGKFSALMRPLGKLLRNGTVRGVSLGSDFTGVVWLLKDKQIVSVSEMCVGDEKINVCKN